MTGMNNALLQLALMLRGNAPPGGGFDGYGSRPFAPNFSPSPMTNPPNSWANMSAPHNGTQGSHLPITPAQEIFLGPLNPAWEIPNWEIPNMPDWAIPKPEFFPIPDTGPLGPDVIPPFPPYNPPLQIPDAQGEDTKLPPITIPQWPHNPPFEVPDESIEDQIQKLTPDRPVTEIPDDPECEEEWNEALERCGREFLQLRKRRTGEHVYFNQERCVKGYVSQRCGGNGVDPKPQIRPYKPQA
jgi:hypothetical protein